MRFSRWSCLPLVLITAVACEQVTEPEPPPSPEQARGRSAHQPVAYEAVDLGTLAGTHSVARAINDRGDVAGYTDVEDEDCSFDPSHAFLWTAQHGMRDLGTATHNPCEESWAADLNNRREVVGSSVFAAGPESGPFYFFWSEENGMRIIRGPEPESLEGGATSINNRSYVAVQYHSITGGPGLDPEFGFIWHPKRGVIQSWTDFFPFKLNDRSDAVGATDRFVGEGPAPAAGPAPAQLLSRGSIRSIAGLAPTDINNRGDLLSGDAIWTEKDGFFGHGGISFNEHREVVGQETFSGESHAFYWSKQTGLVDLGTLGGTWSIAYDINNRGWIVGAAETASGEVHATLWKPSR